MNIRIIDLENDSNTINRWCDERKLNIIPKDYFSKYGFMTFNNDKDIAAAWFYPLEGSKRCLIDCLIANPDSSSEEREESVRLLLVTIILNAEQMGYKYISCHTSYDAVKKNLLDFKFIEHKGSQTYFTGEL